MKPDDLPPALLAAAVPAAPAATSAATPADVDPLYQRIGQLTRTLHDALRELGYDKDLASVREHLPDARDRLSYITRVTGEAAERVLNGVDNARGVQQELTERAADLRARWQAVKVYTTNAEGRATPAGATLVRETCAFFDSIEAQAERTNAILTDIMLAQDFHDLTGQVIRKVVTLAQTVEEQLVKLLLETSPPAVRQEIRPEPRQDTAAPAAGPSLDGPVVKGEGRTDVVTSQTQVDDLLASLGF